MRFTLTVELDNDAVETGADLAALLVRIAPTVECCVGTDLADCTGTVRDLNGREVGNWTCIVRMIPEVKSVSEPASTSSDTTHATIHGIPRKVGYWTFVEPKMPDETPLTTKNTERLTVREINELLDGSRACYVNIGSERIRIRHAGRVNGQLQGKSLFRPGEWITIPSDARIELLD